MKAVGYYDCLPADDPGALVDLELPQPEPRPRDLLVKVSATSVNPVDVKTRLGRPGARNEPQVLGWDACGEVVETGSAVGGFATGDRVWFAGQIDRPGSNAEFVCVDERIAALAPASLTEAQAAALPLTGLTAWECLFERLGYDTEPSDSNERTPLLLINGAGGLGSMILQLGRVAGISVTATASRTVSQDWCRQMGATAVVPHAVLTDLEHASFARIVCAHDTDLYFAEMSRLVAPMGLVCAVASAKQPHDLQPMMAKSAGFVWELMFTRSLFQTEDMAEQGKILARLAAMADDGVVQSTLTETLEGLRASTFLDAHRTLERGEMTGKLVIEYD
jgi:zinc-binding alcohol dehydrogenase family protein